MVSLRIILRCTKKRKEQKKALKISFEGATP
jgi:hypothetical protein